MIFEGETELRLKARTKFEKYDKYSRSETNRFGIVKSEDQNMSPTKTTRQRSHNNAPSKAHHSRYPTLLFKVTYSGIGFFELVGIHLAG